MTGERFAPCCIQVHNRYGGGSVIVWVGILHGQETEDYRIVNGTSNGHRYLNKIALSVVVPRVRTYDLVFQDNNARPHRAHHITSSLERENISKLDCLACSPELSPIEQDCDELGRRTKERSSSFFEDLEGVKDRLLEQWDQIESDYIRNLCESMSTRINECLNLEEDIRLYSLLELYVKIHLVLLSRSNSCSLYVLYILVFMVNFTFTGL